MRLLCSDKHTNVWRHCFVGRRVECKLFRTACQTDTPSFTVLHLFAPGGAGKIARLAEFARLAAEAGARGRPSQSQDRSFAAVTPLPPTGSVGRFSLDGGITHRNHPLGGGC